MPSLTFVLPHWVYWSGMVLFPLTAMYMVRRRTEKGVARGVSLPLAYLLWLTGGFVGLHRFFVRSYLGIGYIPLFLSIIYSNVKGRGARDAISGARNTRLGAEYDLGRFQKAVDQGAEGAAAKLASAQQALASATQDFSTATAAFDQWQAISGGFALAIAVLLLIDAFLLPGLVRRAAAAEVIDEAAAEEEVALRRKTELAAGKESLAPRISNRFTDAIDAISGWSGEFVCYWSIIAVFVYYYEVLARYVFNSPTNWAHESMFLMFGMQYLISGAYAFREGSHVRVDVLYQYLSERARILIDILTSVLFFIFAGTLLVTGWIFMADAIEVWEVSFTEWAVQYWPVKISIVLGAVLILLQGTSKLIKDFTMLAGKGA